MSCMICSDRHIATVASATIENHRSSGETHRFTALAESLGFGYLSVAEGLKKCNLLAFQARYNEASPLCEKLLIDPAEDLPPLALIKLAQCVRYQLAEFDSEDKSPAATLCRAAMKMLNEFIGGALHLETEKYPWMIE